MIRRVRDVARYLPDALQTGLRKGYYRYQILRSAFGSDEPEFAMLGDFVNEGDWVVDIGASIGYYTLALSKLVGETGRVISFEPVSGTFRLLAANMQYAPWRNITLLNVAASSRSGESRIDIPYGDTGLDGHFFARIHTGDPPTGWRSVASESVFRIPLDALDFPRPIRLIKIDVEGHEVAVLQGMRSLIERDRPMMIVETINDAADEIFDGLPYERKRLNGSQNVLYYPLARA